MFVMKIKSYEVVCECPVCSGAFVVTRMSCESCGSALEGKFKLNEFARLNHDDLDFLRAFITARGSIKEVESLLNISYPTVRGRIERLGEKLGLASDKKDASNVENELSVLRKEVLDKLALGEVSIEEAERQLAELRD